MDVFKMGKIVYFITPLLALTTAPFFAGVINKIKAFFAGRKGAPILQLYYDIFKLMKKEIVISDATSMIFKIAPTIVFGSTIAASFIIPFFITRYNFSFTCDFILLFYLLGLGRFFLILSALDTGSAFEGMGASREALFSALTEPIVFISILTVLRVEHSTSLVTALSSNISNKHWIVILLVIVPLFIAMLVENARIPFDDPNTHLELTMIHEVMILDNSGADLAFFEYASSIKLWIFNLLLVKVILLIVNIPYLNKSILTFVLMIIVAIAIGVTESIMARSKLLKIPQLLYSAAVIAGLGFFLAISDVINW